MAISQEEGRRTWFCKVTETEWSDSLAYDGKTQDSVPTIRVGTRLHLQLWMMPRSQSVAPSFAPLFRLEDPTGPIYEISGQVQTVAAQEYVHPAKHVVTYVVLGSMPRVVLVEEGVPAIQSNELAGKHVRAIGTLMGTFFNVFWEAPVSWWVEAEVLAIRDAPYGTKIFEVAIDAPGSSPKEFKYPVTRVA